MNRNQTILIADDDPNDVLLLERALRKCDINNSIQKCTDGEQVIDYLQGKPPYDDRTAYPIPSVMFLDIKMPKATGLDVLKWLQQHPDYQVIPTIVLTASRMEDDVQSAYRLGANSYLVKPAKSADLQQMLRVAYEYWSWCEKPNIRVPKAPTAPP